MSDLRTSYDRVIATRTERRKVSHEMLTKLMDGVATSSGLGSSRVHWVDVDRKKIGSIDFVVQWGHPHKHRDVRAAASLKLVLHEADHSAGQHEDAVYVKVAIVDDKKGEPVYKIEDTTIPSASGLDAAVSETTKIAARLIEEEFSH